MKLRTLLAMYDAAVEIVLMEALSKKFPDAKISETRSVVAVSLNEARNKWLRDLQNLLGAEKSQTLIKKMEDDLLPPS